MGSAVNWQCPHCGRHTTIADERHSINHHRFDLNSKYGKQVLSTMVIACPNPECKEVTVRASIAGFRYNRDGGYADDDPRQTWSLIPQASMKPFPDYIPAPILADYREACLVRDLSPKAAATLARRCLQGMIRDFWGIARDKLVQEIQEIREKVAPDTWDAIESIRKIGNIGAHMEKDINVIVEVDPSEAQLLIELVESLLVEWYVQRHERAKRNAALVGAAATKKPPAANASPRSSG